MITTNGNKDTKIMHQLLQIFPKKVIKVRKEQLLIFRRACRARRFAYEILAQFRHGYTAEPLCSPRNKSTALKRLGVFLLPLDGMLVHRRSLPRNLLGFPNKSPVPIYTPGWREAP